MRACSHYKIKHILPTKKSLQVECLEDALFSQQLYFNSVFAFFIHCHIRVFFSKELSKDSFFYIYIFHLFKWFIYAMWTALTELDYSFCFHLEICFRFQRRRKWEWSFYLRGLPHVIAEMVVCFMRNNRKQQSDKILSSNYKKKVLNYNKRNSWQLSKISQTQLLNSPKKLKRSLMKLPGKLCKMPIKNITL